ncbi:MAG: MFS transporter [Gammaproteobacteria bacterium]|nr:MFS transporter [Gammaproteobacteria bacterium]
MVTLAVLINYVDRGNLATAAPLIQDQLHLSAGELGVLLSAFYYGYVPCMPATGWLAETFGAKAVLAGGVALWSLATLGTGFVGGFAGLLAFRILLGVGESVAFPCASKLLANAVDVGRLGIANGVLSFGYLLGPAIGTLLGGYLMARVGWRPVFWLFGAVALLWLLPWRRARIGPPRGAAAETAPPPFAAILRQRALWGASLGHFASNYGYYFIVSWLPFYLVKARGYSITSMAAIASWAYLLNALGALVMGFASDHWIRHGRSPTLVYKTIMGVTHLSGIACMIGMVALPQTGSILALFAFELISGASYPGLFAIPQIIAGPAATGRWVGIQNAAGNAAGLIAPALTGYLVERTGHFELAFALGAAVNVLGLIGWVFMLPRIAPLDWSHESMPGVHP